MKKVIASIRVLALAAPAAVLAQTPVFGPGGEVSPLQSGQGVIDVLNSLLLWFGIVVGIISVLVIMWAAFLFMTAGSSERSSAAKAWLTWGIVGIVVALFVTVVVPIVISLLSGDIFSPF